MATTCYTLLIMLAISFSHTSFSQQDPFPTVSGCTPRLLQLTSCAAFVQGMAQFPPQSCCNNLKQLSMDQPACLCLLLANSSFTSLFPVNTTLALQLPSLCAAPLDASLCSPPGTPHGFSITHHLNYLETTNSSVVIELLLLYKDCLVDRNVCVFSVTVSFEGTPEVGPPQVSLGSNSSLGRNSNSSIAAASPMVQVGPKPVIMGLGQTRASSVRMKAQLSLALLPLSLYFF